MKRILTVNSDLLSLIAMLRDNKELGGQHFIGLIWMDIARSYRPAVMITFLVKMRILIIRFTVAWLKQYSEGILFGKKKELILFHYIFQDRELSSMFHLRSKSGHCKKKNYSRFITKNGGNMGASKSCCKFTFILFLWIKGIFVILQHFFS